MSVCTILLLFFSNNLILKITGSTVQVSQNHQKVTTFQLIVVYVGLIDFI